MPVEVIQGLPVRPFASQGEWAAWLAEHHTSAQGLWLKLAKKGSGLPSLTYAEAVEAALCYGWIDSQKAGYDETWWLQRFTPRRPRSKWSQINRQKAEELIAQGRMQPAGLREVELARADGRWEAAYTWQASMAVPEDLQRALDENPAAQAFFETLDSANRYAILHRIVTVKKAETRQRNIQKFVAMLAAGEKLYP
jgi:uncharacterized protein YdeI (YjbR/CyaY-like superfamily)